jgi:hypothetical protein
MKDQRKQKVRKVRMFLIRGKIKSKNVTGGIYYLLCVPGRKYYFRTPK